MQPDDVKVQFQDGNTLILRPVEEVSPTFYVNNATFGLTQWEIKIDLSEIVGMAKEEDSPVALINRKARLLMTVPYAKSFADALLKHIAKYESIAAEEPPDQEVAPAAEHQSESPTK